MTNANNHDDSKLTNRAGIMTKAKKKKRGAKRLFLMQYVSLLIKE